MLEREADEAAGHRSSVELEVLSEAIQKLQSELDQAKLEAERLASHARAAAEGLGRHMLSKKKSFGILSL